MTALAKIKINTCSSTRLYIKYRCTRLGLTAWPIYSCMNTRRNELPFTSRSSSNRHELLADLSLEEPFPDALSASY